MATQKNEFVLGAGLMAGFIVIFVIILMPIFNGQNALDYLDGLYNSISKGSAYYFPELKKLVAKHNAQNIEVKLAMGSELQAQQTSLLLMKSGSLVNVNGKEIAVKGDFGNILLSCLDDADAMFHNKGAELKNKYGYDERQAIYNWWSALKAMDKDLTRQKKFAEAKTLAIVSKKGVECAYNYYQIEPQKITDRMGVVTFSLLFYVVYTLWYGFSILFMFEGWGLKLEH